MFDAHLHAVPPNLPGVGPLGKILTEDTAIVAAALRAELKAANMVGALAMGSLPADPDDPLGINATLGIAALVPGLLAAGIMDPTKDEHDDSHFLKVEALLASGRVGALKGYLGYMHFGPDHPPYRRYYSLAGRYRIPVVFHTGDTYSPFAKLKYAHPLGVDEVAVDHRETKFVIAHAGNPWTVDCGEIIYKNVNVWADLSGLTVGDAESVAASAAADVAFRVREAVLYSERPTRWLFGTDWPLVPIASYADFIRRTLPSDYHPLIFTENALNVFRIP
jgi:uncharacterized protein